MGKSSRATMGNSSRATMGKSRRATMGNSRRGPGKRSTRQRQTTVRRLFKKVDTLTWMKLRGKLREQKVNSLTYRSAAAPDPGQTDCSRQIAN